MNNINIETLENFLGATFHQDINSPEEALNEYIEEEEKKWIIDLINNAELFLNSSMSDESKNNFIEENTEIYFPAINLNPLEWFYNVIKKLKEQVKNK
ncbi:contact-dependent growth inhibition system immunity protein [Clostridium saccharobutylicum]|uniref:CdiI immunity protein domain-containing protein n=1 Tax=Clostridium saccharobutylicum TaxID=169679 RepID=A0A1S8N5J7_CLOSA|nr:contact-dependent growth inhibition system immunity protein [Clostridium saccharobutylicum]OOM11717.1 hypothetical protein CLOSAC_21440 [Clostridium saccharobutylicum]